MCMAPWLVRDGSRTGAHLSVAPKPLHSPTQLLCLPKAAPLSSFKIQPNRVFLREVSIILRQSFESAPPGCLANISISILSRGVALTWSVSYSGARSLRTGTGALIGDTEEVQRKGGVRKCLATVGSMAAVSMKMPHGAAGARLTCFLPTFAFRASARPLLREHSGLPAALLGSPTPLALGDG